MMFQTLAQRAFEMQKPKKRYKPRTCATGPRIWASRASPASLLRAGAKTLRNGGAVAAGPTQEKWIPAKPFLVDWVPC